jgi:catechol 2,3-dioxygenase-like lactoylglutathione lyase family enzyme
MTKVDVTVPGTDRRRCGCCGRDRPARRVAELGVTPGVFICSGCALWAARRAGVLSALRQIQPWSKLRGLMRSRDEYTFRAAIPVLPSSDLDRTAAFYAPVGFIEAKRHEGYLLLHGGDVELHFGLCAHVTPGQCFLFVGDAMKLWKQLHGVRRIDRIGPIVEQDYGLREFVLTDPDGNQVRIGSPLD